MQKSKPEQLNLYHCRKHINWKIVIIKFKKKNNNTAAILLWLVSFLFEFNDAKQTKIL